MDLISFSQGPGISNSLKIASLVAKTISLKYNIKIVGVNHIKAHLSFGKMLTKFSDPLYLFVSGVNTQVICFDEKNNSYKIYGETQDIGVGNLFDSFGREIGLRFPQGPKIEQLAKKSKNFIKLPYKIKGMNLNFGGLFSNLKSKIEKKFDKNDLCFSLQETVFSQLLEIVERALVLTNKKEFVIVGGVSANRRLNFMAKKMCKRYKVKFKTFDIKYSMDNGAMIALEGFIQKEKASLNIKKLQIKPYINVESEI